MFIRSFLMVFTYSLIFTLPVFCPCLSKASRAMNVPVRPIPALKQRHIGGYLIQSYDKSSYTNRKFMKSKVATQNLMKKFDNTTRTDLEQLVRETTTKTGVVNRFTGPTFPLYTTFVCLKGRFKYKKRLLLRCIHHFKSEF